MKNRRENAPSSVIYVLEISLSSTCRQPRAPRPLGRNADYLVSRTNASCLATNNVEVIIRVESLLISDDTLSLFTCR